MVARAVVAVLAVAVLAWLAIMEYDVRLQASATDRSRHGASTAELADAAADLHRARLLNPDQTRAIAAAVVANSRGHRADAARRLGEVVRREPDNLLAWSLLAIYARGIDPAAVARASAAHRELDPLNASDR
jgi:hypothetical protein